MTKVNENAGKTAQVTGSASKQTEGTAKSMMAKISNTNPADEKIVVTTTEGVAESNHTAEFINQNNQTSVVNELEEVKAKLELQLKKIEEKKELADKREKFLSTKNDLKNVSEVLSKQRNNFESENFQISFKSSYNGNLFAISNQSLIVKFIECLNAEIDLKVNELETKLMEG